MALIHLREQYFSDEHLLKLEAQRSLRPPVAWEKYQQSNVKPRIDTRQERQMAVFVTLRSDPEKKWRGGEYSHGKEAVGI